MSIGMEDQRKLRSTLHFKEVALAVFFYIEEAFDKAKTAKIRYALHVREVNPTLINWARSVLQQGNIKAALGDQMDIRVKRGCSHGILLTVSNHGWFPITSNRRLLCTSICP